MNSKYRLAFKKVLRIGSYSTTTANVCESFTSDQPKSPLNKNTTYVAKEISD